MSVNARTVHFNDSHGDEFMVNVTAESTTVVNVTQELILLTFTHDDAVGFAYELLEATEKAIMDKAREKESK